MMLAGLVVAIIVSAQLPALIRRQTNAWRLMSFLWLSSGCLPLSSTNGAWHNASLGPTTIACRYFSWVGVTFNPLFIAFNHHISSSTRQVNGRSCVIFSSTS